MLRTVEFTFQTNPAAKRLRKNARRISSPRGDIRGIAHKNKITVTAGARIAAYGQIEIIEGIQPLEFFDVGNNI